MRDRALRIATPSAVALLAWSLSLTPLCDAIPGLGLLRGPLGLVLLAVGAGSSFVAWRPPSPIAISDAALFACSTALFLALGLPFVHRVQASGDEVEYLLMAQSLWREGDLDVRDNWERGDYLDYVPGMERPMSGTVTAKGTPISTHSPGLPALLAPVYALGGRKACVVFMSLLGSWLAILTRRLARRLTDDETAALAAWAAVVASPVAFYTFYLYTEVPSALAVVLALVLLTGEPTAFRAGSAALAVATLPWLHVKMVPAAAVLGLVALVRLRGRSLFAFVSVGAVMALAYVGYYQIVFGHPTPLALYGVKTPRQIRNATPFASIPGMLLDASFGLLPHAPAFLGGLAGLALLPRRPRAQWLPVAGVLLAILAPLVTWRVWWAGFCPPARFLVPAVPILALGLALLVARGRGLARWTTALLAIGLGLVVFMSLEPEETRMVNGRDEATRVWTALQGTVPLDHYLPHLARRSGGDWLAASVLLTLILGLLALDAVARSKDRVDRLFRGLAFPLALLVGGATAVDLLRYAVGAAP